MGERKTAQESIPVFKEFFHKLRFDFLQPIEYYGAGVRHPLWGRLPPEFRYNMYQVPLNFFNGQYDTFTVEVDDDVNVKYPR